MIDSHKHQQPPFQRFWGTIPSGSSQEISYPAVHALHHIRGRGQIEIGMQQIRAILFQSPDDFPQTIAIRLGTQRMGDVSPHTRNQFPRDQRVSCCDDFLHCLICSSPPAPPSDAPLDASQEYMKAGHEVEVASLQNPTIIGYNMLNASNTVGNQGQNAVTNVLGYVANTPTPSFRRFPLASHDRPQEDGILSIDASHRHQIRRPSPSLKAEPQAVNHHEQRTRGNKSRPWRAVQGSKRCRVPLAYSGDSLMRTPRFAGQRLLISHRMGDIGQSPLPRFSPSPFLPHRPSRSASHASLPALAVSMNDRVQAPDFSVLCFHTQRIQDRNREASLIFLA